LERNIISGNGDGGVVFDIGEIDYNVVAGNYTGLDVTGTRALGSEQGVAFARGTGVGNTIGGSAAAARNVISSSGGHFGIRIVPYQPGDSWSQTVIAGNFIGTDKTGRNTTDPDGVPLGSIYGVNIEGAEATGTEVEGNVIGGSWFGLYVSLAAGTVVSGNWIGTDSYGDNLGNSRAGVVLDGGTTATQVGGAGLSSNTIAFNGWEAGPAHTHFRSVPCKQS
jgi:titin